MENNTYIVKTLQGLEPALEQELIELGAAEVLPLKRAVSFVGDKAMLYRANYELRTALRILSPIHTFLARDERQFYGRVRDEVDWALHLSPTDTLAVDAIVSSETFRHSKYMALTVKDAIVDQFRDRFGKRPSVDVENPTLRITVRIHENRCDLLLDSSGESLHRRGYRTMQGEAPINEVLGAGMIRYSGWNGLGDFVDPMCGSGTLPIEAAMVAKKIPAQFLRKTFGFFNWKDFDRTLWEQVRAAADSKIQEHDFQILAYDKEGRARTATAENVEMLGLENLIKIDRVPFEALEPEDGTRGILMTNPPYDERLRVEDMAEFYGMIGTRLKHFWPGWKAWIISSNKEAMHHISLRPSRRFTLYNGALECYFHRYDMFEGKKGHGGKQ